MLRTIKEIKGVLPVANNNQRNWDLSKPIPDEHLQFFKQVVYESPRQENNTYYNVHFITNRELIEKIYDNSEGSGPASSHPAWGNSTPRDDDMKEPQVLSNLLVIFEENIDHGQLTGYMDDVGESLREEIERDKFLAMGNAAGMLVAYAIQLGYKTGYNICLNDENRMTIEHIMELDNKPSYMVSIGHGNEGVDHKRHHKDHSIKYGKFGRITPLGKIKVWE